MGETADRLEIQPLTKPPLASVRVPGSKSITNRALVLAALSDPELAPPLEPRVQPSRLLNVLRSEDTEIMVNCLSGLDVWVEDEWEQGRLIVHGSAGKLGIPDYAADLFVGNSGTTMRFVTALAALAHGPVRLDGVPRMRERPIGPLLHALAQLGVKTRCERAADFPPLIVEGRGALQGGQVQIRTDVSSQFLSGLLMIAPLARHDVTIEVPGPLVSSPYVEMTLRMMRDFGARVEVEELRRFRIPAKQRYFSRDYLVEPDASAASYFFAAAAITGGQVTVQDLTAKSIQGDIRFVDLLEEMGCQVVRGKESLTVHGGPLHGIDADMNDISDTVMTLAVVACFAEGPTTIRNVAHIRHKETDRLAALATELRRIGAEVEELSDGLKITPGRLHGAEIETYNDHRMAMSLSLVGLKVPGIVIKNPACVGKTYPQFFADLEKLR